MLHLHLKYIKCLKCMCVHCTAVDCTYVSACVSRFLRGVMEQQKPKERETGRRRGEQRRTGGREGRGEAMHGQRGQT